MEGGSTDLQAPTEGREIKEKSTSAREARENGAGRRIELTKRTSFNRSFPRPNIPHPDRESQAGRVE